MGIMLFSLALSIYTYIYICICRDMSTTFYGISYSTVLCNITWPDPVFIILYCLVPYLVTSSQCSDFPRPELDEGHKALLLLVEPVDKRYKPVKDGQGRVHPKPRRSSGIRNPQEAGGGQARQYEGQGEQAALRAHSISLQDSMSN